MGKIQKPTIGRIVEFTARRGNDPEIADVYAGVITKVHYTYDVVDITTFGSDSIHQPKCVPYSAEGKLGTWRYPLRNTEEIDV